MGSGGLISTRVDEWDPKYRSRLVAMDFKRRRKREDLFAATPPLEAIKMLLSITVIKGLGRRQWNDTFKMDFIDVRRANFHA